MLWNFVSRKNPISVYLPLTSIPCRCWKQKFGWAWLSFERHFFTLEIYNVGHIIIWSFLNFRYEKNLGITSVNYFFELRLRLFTKDSQRIEYGKQISYTIADVNGRIITDQDFEDADVRERSASTEGESKKKKPVTMLTLFSIWSVAKVTLIQEMIKLSLGSLKIVNSKIGWQN